MPGRLSALRVILGRGTSRGFIQLSTVALLPAWGAAEFGPFVAALGTFGWVVYLVAGTEKAGLTVLPRTRVLRDQYTRMLLVRAAAPLAVALVAIVVLLPFGGRPVLYAAAAAYSAGLALLSALAIRHRLADHPGRDAAAFLSFAGWNAVVATLAVLGVLAPVGYLLALVAGLIIECAVLALALPSLWRRARRRGRRLSAMVNRRVLLLGLSDVADAGSTAVLYIVLAAVATPADTATVYLVLLASGLLSGFIVLLLRLAQPWFSLRLRGTGSSAGRLRARRLSGWAAVVTGGALAVAVVGLVCAYLVGGTSFVAAIGSNPVALGVAVAVELAAFCVVLFAVFLLENTNGLALSMTSAAALTGLLATAGTAVILVPVLHAVGALLALVAGLATKASFLHQRLTGTVTLPRTRFSSQGVS